ncbi:hypothetical protein [Desulfovibrio litoralis]|uniref:Uncharacterized protein n=1 Tax=Desulfovibrio litoralis DSM 11393 TaxID=1121455 RepID=A0A1M7TK39_9BACT|nr:hypothetical protein [Desulfovibrio litoralis]SHN71081.1 hypothetical protein SAMN02745728_02138 [Desulfovibrio litoralis DSM 11393]
MSYDIRLVKLVSSELVLGKFDAESNSIKDPANLQTVPSQQDGGVQLMLLPYGYPFEQDFTGSISMTHVLFEYKNCPEEIKTRYLEACSKLTLSSGGLGGLDLRGEAAAANASGLILGKK